MEQSGSNKREWLPWFAAAIAVVFSSLTATSIWEIVDIWLLKKPGTVSYSGGVFICLFILSVRWSYKQRNNFFPPKARRLVDEDTVKRKHLILFLSWIRAKWAEEEKGVPPWLKLKHDSLDKDIKRIKKLKLEDDKKRWPWEMPLRGIRHHLGRLESITIICSKESIGQLKFFLEICDEYDELKGVKFYSLARNDNNKDQLFEIRPDYDIHAYKGYAFEGFDQVVYAMRILLAEFGGKGHPHDEIMIDITSGQKPTSVVAAVMTVNLDIKAQYVQTNAPWKVVSYDIKIASADTGKLGI